MVELMSSEDFIMSIGRAMKVRFNMSLYSGCYSCACGEQHYYSEGSLSNEIKLLAQGKQRVVMLCPDDPDCFTNVAIKLGFLGFSFKGFESISGTKCETKEERVGLMYVFNQLP